MRISETQANVGCYKKCISFKSGYRPKIRPCHSAKSLYSPETILQNHRSLIAYTKSIPSKNKGQASGLQYYLMILNIRESITKKLYNCFLIFRNKFKKFYYLQNCSEGKQIKHSQYLANFPFQLSLAVSACTFSDSNSPEVPSDCDASSFRCLTNCLLRATLSCLPMNSFSEKVEMA